MTGAVLLLFPKCSGNLNTLTTNHLYTLAHSQTEDLSNKQIHWVVTLSEEKNKTKKLWLELECIKNKWNQSWCVQRFLNEFEMLKGS